MKHFFLRPTLLLLLSVFSCSWNALAAPIDRTKAARLAAHYIQLTPQHLKAAPNRQAMPGEAPTYYLFNDARQRGFVIVSGDDATAPILAYAPEGSLKEGQLPEALDQLLQQHSRRIKARRAAGITAGLPSPPPKAGAQAVKGPLLRSLWNQNAPFNDRAPLIGQQRTVTGCVATAMAQLMYFHRWPQRGIGANIYDSQTGKHSANFAESVYDWSNMLDLYAQEDAIGFGGGSGRPLWNEKQANAVAQLL